MFKIIELDSVTQRNDWLNWRKDGIGSSDCPAIIGVSRYRTAEELLQDKISPTVEDTSNKYIKDRGNKIELRVRRFMEQQQLTEFAPVNCENIEYPFMRASLDGLSFLGTFLEIKLLSSTKRGSKVNKEAAGYKKWVTAKDSGEIPEDYYPQIQHQLMVTGLDKCIFVGLKEVRGQDTVKLEDLAIVEVSRNEDYIEMLRELESKFWNKVLTGREQLSKVV